MRGKERKLLAEILGYLRANRTMIENLEKKIVDLVAEDKSNE